MQYPDLPDGPIRFEGLKKPIFAEVIDFRKPNKGEHYLSGSIPEAYKARSDNYDTSYWIVHPSPINQHVQSCQHMPDSKYKEQTMPNHYPFDVPNDNISTPYKDFMVGRLYECTRSKGADAFTEGKAYLCCGAYLDGAYRKFVVDNTGSLVRLVPAHTAFREVR